VRGPGFDLSTKKEKTKKKSFLGDFRIQAVAINYDHDVIKHASKFLRFIIILSATKKETIPGKVLVST
jgi:hypothetical protein